MSPAPQKSIILLGRARKGGGCPLVFAGRPEDFGMPLFQVDGIQSKAL